MASAQAQHVEVEAAKLLHKLIQESKDEPLKLATKLYVICQHMKISGKEQSLPYQVISRAMESVVSRHGLDMAAVQSSRLTFPAPQMGSSGVAMSKDKEIVSDQPQMVENNTSQSSMQPTPWQFSQGMADVGKHEGFSGKSPLRSSRIDSIGLEVQQGLAPQKGSGKSCGVDSQGSLASEDASGNSQMQDSKISDDIENKKNVGGSNKRKRNDTKTVSDFHPVDSSKSDAISTGTNTKGKQLKGQNNLILNEDAKNAQTQSFQNSSYQDRQLALAAGRGQHAFSMPLAPNLHEALSSSTITPEHHIGNLQQGYFPSIPYAWNKSSQALAMKMSQGSSSGYMGSPPGVNLEGRTNVGNCTVLNSISAGQMDFPASSTIGSNSLQGHTRNLEKIKDVTNVSSGVQSAASLASNSGTSHLSRKMTESQIPSTNLPEGSAHYGTSGLGSEMLEMQQTQHYGRIPSKTDAAHQDGKFMVQSRSNGQGFTSQLLPSSNFPFNEQQLKQLRAQCLVFLAFRSNLIPRRQYLEIALGSNCSTERSRSESRGPDNSAKEPGSSHESSGMLARPNDFPRLLSPSAGSTVDTEASSKDAAFINGKLRCQDSSRMEIENSQREAENYNRAAIDDTSKQIQVSAVEYAGPFRDPVHDEVPGDSLANSLLSSGHNDLLLSKEHSAQMFENEGKHLSQFVNVADTCTDFFLEDHYESDDIPASPPRVTTSVKWIMDRQKRIFEEEQKWEYMRSKAEEKISVCSEKLKVAVSSSEDLTTKTKSVIELKKLQLFQLQRRLRSEFLTDFCKPIILDMERIKVIKKHRHGRRVKQLEKVEQKMKEERQKRIRDRQKEFFSELEAHREKLEDWYKTKRERAKGFNRFVREFHKRKERIHREKIDRIQREKINLLKNNDVEGYLRMVQDAKSDRVKQLLKETEKYLQKLGSKLQDAKSLTKRFGTEIDEQSVDVFEAIADLEDENYQAQHYLESNEKYYQLAHSVKEIINVQPTYLQGGKLREYQLNGLRWLVSLYNNNLNGILADEMGLGKTVQVISLLCYLMEAKNDRGPFLVVVPSSVLPGWVSELSFWAPSINVIVYAGTPEDRRKLFKEVIIHQRFNVLLTTYEFMMNKHDRPKLSKILWHYVIIDEGHRIKNASCKLNADLKHYRSSHRLLLTGTPLQNNLEELWALLNFLLPNIFNSSEDFSQWFNKPFEGSGDTSLDEALLSEEENLLIINRLHQVLRPFVLRRLKHKVENELPEKIERLVRCEASAYQKLLIKRVKENLGSFRNTKVRSVQNTVMQMRNICNHPYLSQLHTDEVENYLPKHYLPSMIRLCGKLEMLDRLLPKLKATGHRVLLFSTMTRLLDIMEDYLNWKGYKYLRLDGHTAGQDRGAIIDKFNHPESQSFIFLLSIRAGGVGVNLQAADTVIIFDTDWNPQVDLQAQARAHRIGQKKDVLVLRLETVRTVEEQVRASAEHKLGVANQSITAGFFDNNTSAEDRREYLESLLRECKKEESAAVLDDDALNDLLARSECEIDVFESIDKQRREEEMSAWQKLIEEGLVEGKDTLSLPPRLVMDNDLKSFCIAMKVHESSNVKVKANVNVKRKAGSLGGLDVQHYGRGKRAREVRSYEDQWTEEEFEKMCQVDSPALSPIVEAPKELGEVSMEKSEHGLQETSPESKDSTSLKRGRGRPKKGVNLSPLQASDSSVVRKLEVETHSDGPSASSIASLEETSVEDFGDSQIKQMLPISARGRSSRGRGGRARGGGSRGRGRGKKVLSLSPGTDCMSADKAIDVGEEPNISANVASSQVQSNGLGKYNDTPPCNANTDASEMAVPRDASEHSGSASKSASIVAFSVDAAADAGIPQASVPQVALQPNPAMPVSLQHMENWPRNMGIVDKLEENAEPSRRRKKITRGSDNGAGAKLHFDEKLCSPTKVNKGKEDDPVPNNSEGQPNLVQLEKKSSGNPLHNSQVCALSVSSSVMTGLDEGSNAAVEQSIVISPTSDGSLAEMSITSEKVDSENMPGSSGTCGRGTRRRAAVVSRELRCRSSPSTAACERRARLAASKQVDGPKKQYDTDDDANAVAAVAVENKHETGISKDNSVTAVIADSEIGQVRTPVACFLHDDAVLPNKFELCDQNPSETGQSVVPDSALSTSSLNCVSATSIKTSAGSSGSTVVLPVDNKIYVDDKSAKSVAEQITDNCKSSGEEKLNSSVLSAAGDDLHVSTKPEKEDGNFGQIRQSVSVSLAEEYNDQMRCNDQLCEETVVARQTEPCSNEWKDLGAGSVESSIETAKQSDNNMHSHSEDSHPEEIDMSTLKSTSSAVETGQQTKPMSDQQITDNCNSTGEEKLNSSLISAAGGLLHVFEKPEKEGEFGQNQQSVLVSLAEESYDQCSDKLYEETIVVCQAEPCGNERKDLGDGSVESSIETAKKFDNNVHSHSLIVSAETEAHVEHRDTLSEPFPPDTRGLSPDNELTESIKRVILSSESGDTQDSQEDAIIATAEGTHQQSLAIASVEMSSLGKQMESLCDQPSQLLSVPCILDVEASLKNSSAQSLTVGAETMTQAESLSPDDIELSSIGNTNECAKSSIVGSDADMTCDLASGGDAAIVEKIPEGEQHLSSAACVNELPSANTADSVRSDPSFEVVGAVCEGEDAAVRENISIGELQLSPSAACVYRCPVANASHDDSTDPCFASSELTSPSNQEACMPLKDPLGETLGLTESEATESLNPIVRNLENTKQMGLSTSQSSLQFSDQCELHSEVLVDDPSLDCARSQKNINESTSSFTEIAEKSLPDINPNPKDIAEVRKADSECSSQLLLSQSNQLLPFSGAHELSGFDTITGDKKENVTQPVQRSPGVTTNPNDISTEGYSGLSSQTPSACPVESPVREAPEILNLESSSHPAVKELSESCLLEGKENQSSLVGANANLSSLVTEREESSTVEAPLCGAEDLPTGVGCESLPSEQPQVDVKLAFSGSPDGSEANPGTEITEQPDEANLSSHPEKSENSLCTEEKMHSERTSDTILQPSNPKPSNPNKSDDPSIVETTVKQPVSPERKTDVAE